MKKGSIVIILALILTVWGVVGVLAYQKFYKKSPALQTEPLDSESPDYSYRDEYARRAMTTPTPSPKPETAEIINSSTRVYSYSDFGIYAPSFVGKQVEYYTFKFRSKEIKARTLFDTDAKQRVEVWEYEKPAVGNVDTSDKYYATFLGYENYSNLPTYLSEIQANWKESYTNANGIKFWLGVDILPKGFGGLEYVTLQTSKITGRPIFIKVGVDFPGLGLGYPLDSPKNAPIVSETKAKLQKFADTVSLTR